MHPPIVELLAIGREILDGRVIDTNSNVIAEELRAIGLVARYGQRVDDDIERIVASFRVASERANIVLVTGGLGPTSDDLTAQAFAKFLGEPLRLDETALAQITDRFQRAGVEMLDVQKKQAFVPLSCFIIENKNGTAPGFGLRQGEVEWHFMPGVPREMTLMLREQVLPRIRSSHPELASARSATWATQFTSEGELQNRLSPIEKKLGAGYELTYRTHFPENHIGLYATAAPGSSGRHGEPGSPGQPSKIDTAVFNGLCAEIDAVLGTEVFSRAADGEALETLEAAVVRRLTETGHCLATAESCTGGLIAHRLTNVSGSSNAFWGTTVAYDNAAKEALGVSKQTLIDHGAVSKQVAAALAEAGLRQMVAHSGLTARGKPLCVATTGIAGPGGGTDAKPVGLCFIALARLGASGDAVVTVEELKGRKAWGRDYLKTFFAQKALELVRKSL